MPYSWEEVRQAVERREDARLERALAEREIAEGRVAKGFYLVRRSRFLLELIGGVVTGVHVAVIVLVLNFLVFIFLLHVNFDYFS